MAVQGGAGRIDRRLLRCGADFGRIRRFGEFTPNPAANFHPDFPVNPAANFAAAFLAPRLSQRCLWRG